MGAGKSQCPDFKKIYLKKTKEQKQIYFEERKNIIPISYFSHWRDFMIKEILEVKAKFSDAKWVDELIAFCKVWNSFKDQEWRWNIIWYDYLRTSSKKGLIYRRMRSNLEVLNNDYYLEFDTIYDLLHAQLINYKSNFIGGIIALFNKSFHEQYYAILESRFVVDNTRTNVDVLEDIFSEIKSFIFLAIQALCNYYGGTVVEKIHNSPEEIYDFILEETIMEYSHNVLLKAFSLKYCQNEIIYLEKIEKFKNLTCADLGIDPKFQLDKCSILPAYHQAILQLKEIEKVYSPCKKLQVIIQTSRIVCDSIDEYWARLGTPQQICLDSDQIISIFCYIIVKAGIKNLRGHIGIVQKLARLSKNNSSMGYYVVTLEACIEQIEHFDFIG